MNILFSCAGRRNYLLKYFREALRGDGSVLATDLSPLAPAMAEADKALTVPRVDASGYIDELINICKDNEVGLLISLNDHELPILASSKDKFQQVGTKIVVSAPSVVELCFDKGATARFAEELGIKVPHTFEHLEEARSAIASGALTFPLFVKPRWGTASTGIEKVENIDELELAWHFGIRKLDRQGLRTGDDKASGLLIQQALPGHEYGVDIVNDLDGRHQATFIKRKLGMRAGETDKAVTEDNPSLKAAAQRIAIALKHIGNLDCDFFVNGDEIYLLEMNPRFGGGYPFTAEAGGDVPAALIAWAKGLEPPVGWDNLQIGITTAKCDRLVRVG